MAFYMAYIGTVFLFSNHGFVELLLNAVALAFIFDVDEYIFEYLISEDTKKELYELEPLCFNSSMPSNPMFNGIIRKEIFGFILIPIGAFIGVWLHNTYNIGPVVEALQCLCNNEGEHCLESNRFPSYWWDAYWALIRNLVPAVQ
jgi:hypothetical protein